MPERLVTSGEHLSSFTVHPLKLADAASYSPPPSMFSMGSDGACTHSACILPVWRRKVSVCLSGTSLDIAGHVLLTRASRGISFLARTGIDHTVAIARGYLTVYSAPTFPLPCLPCIQRFDRTPSHPVSDSLKLRAGTTSTGAVHVPVRPFKKSQTPWSEGLPCPCGTAKSWEIIPGLGAYLSTQQLRRTPATTDQRFSGIWDIETRRLALALRQQHCTRLGIAGAYRYQSGHPQDIILQNLVHNPL